MAYSIAEVSGLLLTTCFITSVEVMRSTPGSRVSCSS